MARAFADAGMKVVIADIRDDHLAEGMKALSGKRAHAVKLDVTDRANFARAADETERVFGKIHVLCNNAGIGLAGPAKLATFEDWDWVMNVDLGGVINGVVTILPRILAHGEGGHIVNTASMSGIMPNLNTIQYTTAKAGVIGMSEVLHGELLADNIGASAFCPGPVRTQIGKSGETRPSHLANTGYAETDRQRATGRGLNVSLWMDALDVGNIVLNGIRRNDLYIFTHSEFGPGLQERCDAIMAAVPDKPRNPEFEKEVPFLLHNPIFLEWKGKE
jgi:NAD(P)-dependent dehydrogenase (short-subunit alcohol dehydrogenase family)